MSFDEVHCHGHVQHDCTFPPAASKSAFLSFLVFSWHVDPLRDVSLFLSFPLLLCILQVMDRNRWIRNLGRKLKVYIQLARSFPSFFPSVLPTKSPIPMLLPYAIRANRTSLLSLQLMPSLVRAFSQFLREKGACQKWRGERKETERKRKKERERIKQRRKVRYRRRDKESETGQCALPIRNVHGIRVAAATIADMQWRKVSWLLLFFHAINDLLERPLSMAL